MQGLPLITLFYTIAAIVRDDFNLTVHSYIVYFKPLLLVCWVLPVFVIAF